jgi:hypothetical protein
MSQNPEAKPGSKPSQAPNPEPRRHQRAVVWPFDSPAFYPVGTNKGCQVAVASIEVLSLGRKPPLNQAYLASWMDTDSEAERRDRYPSQKMARISYGFRVHIEWHAEPTRQRPRNNQRLAHSGTFALIAKQFDTSRGARPCGARARSVVDNGRPGEEPRRGFRSMVNSAEDREA